MSSFYNERLVNASALVVGSTILINLVDRMVVKDITSTKHSVVVDLVPENYFDKPQRHVFRKTDKVTEIDCLALRIAAEEAYRGGK